MIEPRETLNTPEARIRNLFEGVQANQLDHAAGLVQLGGQRPDDQVIIRLRYDSGELEEAVITQPPVEGESTSFTIKFKLYHAVDLTESKHWTNPVGASETAGRSIIHLEEKRDLLDIFGMLGTTYLRESNYKVFPDKPPKTSLGSRALRWAFGQKEKNV